MPSALVVGAGVFGASLADRLVARGWEVTLVEQFAAADERSESGAETRMLRYSHGADGFYAELAWRARELWAELGVLEEVGVVWLARREGGWESDSERVLRSLSIPVERLEPAAAARLYPSLSVGDLAFALLEPAAGVLRAADGVRALVERARAGGLRIEQGEARPAGQAVALGDRLLEADHVVWACGAWLARLFGSLLRLRVTRQDVVLFDAGPEWAGAPGWLDFDASVYGHALIEPYGLKVASDREGAEVEPGLRPPAAPDASLTAARDYVAMRFPALAGAAVRSSPACHYSLTADANFVFARHPEHERVWLLGGGSGHGYKHGPALAQHVAEALAGEAQPEPRFALGERTPSRALRTAGS
ncbi:MAG: NAD(P)/FAD-dependent oxidoreductase [Solirubrobacteraceae bacterium]